MMSVFFKKLNNLSIRYKLFISYLALITLPICLFLAINLYYANMDSENRTLFSLKQVLNQTSSFLEFKAQSVKSILDMLALNNQVQDLVTKDAGVYRDNVGFWMGDDANFAKTVFSTTQNDPNISRIRLYMRSGLAAVVDTDDYILMGRVENESWYRKLESSIDKMEWFPGQALDKSSGSGYISAVRKIPNAQNINGFVGIIRADIPVDDIKTTLEQSLFTLSTSAYLINSDRNVICASGGTTLANTDFSAMLAGIGDSSGENIWKTEKLNNEEYLLAGQSIQYTDWKLILAVPYKDILESGVKTRKQMLLIFLCVAPLTLPLSFLIAGSATKRIRRLISHMKKAGQGDFGMDILPSSEDEIGQLTRNFNHMLTRMAILVDEQFKLGRDIKSKELKALQAQINPHFLYNTLDLINWMSIRYKATEITSLVDALSKFYKLSLSKGEDIIPLSDELDHVRAYVLIQNMRFSNSINLVLDVPEDLYGYQVLKIILQPLVENSILHGILEKEEESGTITISGWVENEVLVLQVQDDGMGMPEEILQDIPAGIQSKDIHGYGARNISERIRLIYGNEYGLTYKSIYGVGTTARIRIPARKP